MVFSYGYDCKGVAVRVPIGAGFFFSFYVVQTGSETHRALNRMGIGAFKWIPAALPPR
jgi:hypothetical protein